MSLMVNPPQEGDESYALWKAEHDEGLASLRCLWAELGAWGGLGRWVPGLVGRTSTSGLRRVDSSAWLGPDADPLLSTLWLGPDADPFFALDSSRCCRRRRAHAMTDGFNALEGVTCTFTEGAM